MLCLGTSIKSCCARYPFLCINGEAKTCPDRTIGMLTLKGHMLHACSALWSANRVQSHTPDCHWASKAENSGPGTILSYPTRIVGSANR